MAEAPIEIPQKTRELHGRLDDSTIWNDFAFRDGDIVIDTPGKTGTNWMLQIVSQLIFQGEDGLHQAEVSLHGNVDVPHRRAMTTHLPLDALVFSPKARYIYVGRDTRDKVWSLYNHASSWSQWMLDMVNARPGPWPPIERPKEDVRTAYLYFLEHGRMKGMPETNFWEHVRGWWAIRHLPNVLLVHFNKLKADLPGETRRIAAFLDIAVSAAVLAKIVAHCSIDYMREAARAKPRGLAMVLEGGADAAFYKGTNGRWKDVLSPEEIARCDEVAAAKLGPDCAHWLKTGELPV